MVSSPKSSCDYILFHIDDYDSCASNNDSMLFARRLYKVIMFIIMKYTRFHYFVDYKKVLFIFASYKKRKVDLSLK